MENLVTKSIQFVFLSLLFSLSINCAHSDSSRNRSCRQEEFKLAIAGCNRLQATQVGARVKKPGVLRQLRAGKYDVGIRLRDGTVFVGKLQVNCVELSQVDRMLSYSFYISNEVIAGIKSGKVWSAWRGTSSGTRVFELDLGLRVGP